MRGSPEERFWPKVDKTDGCWLWTAYVNHLGYGQLGRGRRGEGQVGAHVFSWELIHGPVPAGKEIDHRPTCPKRCVNPEHLRAITHKQNLENRAGPNRNSTSGFRGVTFRKDCNKWEAKIGHNGRIIRSGLFDTIEEANEAAIALYRKYHTHSDWDVRFPNTLPPQERKRDDNE